jgi:hypothetical protein
MQSISPRSLTESCWSIAASLRWWTTLLVTSNFAEKSIELERDRRYWLPLRAEFGKLGQGGCKISKDTRKNAVVQGVNQTD